MSIIVKLVDNLKKKIDRFRNNNRPRLFNSLLIILVAISAYWVYGNYVKSGSSANQVIVENYGRAGLITATPSTSDLSGTVLADSIINSKDSISSNSERLTKDVWIANDLTANSLKDSKSYTVKAGDTLWEISKAHFGTGFEWGKILEANKDKIGFMPNGDQTRIEIGTILNLP